MTGALERLESELRYKTEGRARLVVAIAGPPGAGKSTFAEALVGALDRAEPGSAVLVPMDGYHYDNAVLEARGLRSRKGAPATFDAAGLAADLDRIRRGDPEVAVPVFDRALDVSRGSARIVAPAHRLVVVEGNYLLLDAAPWTGLRERFDYTLRLDVAAEELRRRLVARWLDHGMGAADAIRRAGDNDLPNARLVAEASVAADATLRFDVESADWRLL